MLMTLAWVQSLCMEKMAEPVEWEATVAQAGRVAQAVLEVRVATHGQILALPEVMAVTVAMVAQAVTVAMAVMEVMGLLEATAVIFISTAPPQEFHTRLLAAILAWAVLPALGALRVLREPVALVVMVVWVILTVRLERLAARESLEPTATMARLEPTQWCQATTVVNSKMNTILPPDPHPGWDRVLILLTVAGTIAAMVLLASCGWRCSATPMVDLRQPTLRASGVNIQCTHLLP